MVRVVLTWRPYRDHTGRPRHAALIECKLLSFIFDVYFIHKSKLCPDQYHLTISRVQV